MAAKSSARDSIKLTSVDDLFSTQESRAEEQREKVMDIPISEISDFPNHPFKVKADEAMMEMAESIKQYGVIIPCVVRPKADGGYEMIAGHRRKKASELVGKETVPCIIRDIDRDEAIISMVDSNLQRENISPSEKAFAYKMKLEAIKRKAGRPSINSPQVAANFRSDDEVAETMGISGDTLRRYTRLTELIPELLNMVDEKVDDKKIALTPAYELSFLKKDEQKLLLDAMDSEQATPSLSQAQRLKKFSQEGTLSIDMMRAIMSEEKKGELDRITLTGDKIKKYFPKSYTPQQMEATILKLLEGWYKKRQQSLER